MKSLASLVVSSAFLALSAFGMSPAMAQRAAATGAAPSPNTVSVTVPGDDAGAAAFLRTADTVLPQYSGTLQSLESQINPRTGAVDTKVVFEFREPVMAQTFLPALSAGQPPGTEGCSSTSKCDPWYGCGSSSTGTICWARINGKQYWCSSNWICGTNP